MQEVLRIMERVFLRSAFAYRYGMILETSRLEAGDHEKTIPNRLARASYRYPVSRVLHGGNGGPVRATGCNDDRGARRCLRFDDGCRSASNGRNDE